MPDRISNLPSIVLECILECLPLKDAVRTSILSKEWRCKWLLLRHLILDEDFIHEFVPLNGNSDCFKMYSDIVNSILLRHPGPIHEFVLYVPKWLPLSTDISQWLMFVPDKGVKKFILDDYRGLRMEVELPSCLFSFVGLTHLTLSYCYMCSLPSTFSGFPCLTSLKLYPPTLPGCINPKALGILVSSCPQLENLLFYAIEFSRNITIHAPKLRKLTVGGYLYSIHLKGTTKIKKLQLEASWQLKKELTKFFCCLSNVETLVLDDGFWQTRHCKEMPEIANELGLLTTLKLVRMQANCQWGITFALCLIRSSPNLQSLEIEASRYCESCDDTLLQIKEDCILRCLKSVVFISGFYLSHVLQLMKLLLACAPVLESMTVVLRKETSGTTEKLNIQNQLMGYHRASRNVKIYFQEN